MKAQDVMTKNPVCCEMQTNLLEVSRMMVIHDCGSIPVVGSLLSMRLQGIITDRDIVCRSIAQGKNPLRQTASECMSIPVIVATPDMSLEECCRLMENNQIRRLPVVDENQRCCGVVTQAHIAKHAKASTVAQVLKDISQKNDSASHVLASTR